MKRYDDLILGKLLEKYERSSLSRGVNQRKVSIAYKITEKELPEYFDVSRLDYEYVHSQLAVLEQAGLISLKWQKGREGKILDRCLLVTEKVPEAYRRLSRPSRQQKEERLLQMLEAYALRLPVFVRWVRERLSANASIKLYLDLEDPIQAERICHLAAAIRENRTRQFLRQFSVAVFSDSKAAEREIVNAARILADFESEGRLRGLETQEILEEYLIFKNPSWIYMKGGPFAREYPGGIGVTEEDALRLSWDEKHKITAILTIENLTTFHQWESGALSMKTNDREELVIYLAGYANRGKREFLRKLHAAYPDARFFHYGDIDCGGFRIWKTLAQGTGLPIEPFRMDLPTYLKNLRSGRPLTDLDRKTLQEMLSDPFFENQRELFREMLARGVKLEQESL